MSMLPVVTGFSAADVVTARGPLLVAPNPQAMAEAPLSRVVRPQARERWTALMTAGMTPARVEQILRGAFTGHVLAQWELFDLMEDTWPMLAKCLLELKEAVQMQPLVVHTYKPDGAKEPSARAKAKADLLEAARFATMPDVTRDENSWEEMVFDALDAFGKGLSVQEIFWNLGAIDGRPAIVPRAFRLVHPLHYGYPYRPGGVPDETEPGLQLLLSPRGDQSDWQEFPADKFIIARYRSKSGWPMRAALLRKLAAFWIGSNFAYDWALNLAQMFGLPIRWATYDPHAPNANELLDEISDMLQNMGSAGWGAFPSGTTLELKEGVKNAAENPQSFVLNIADTAASLLILGQTLTSDSKSHGTQALGTVHMAVRTQRILYVTSWLANVLNYSLVPSLMRLNFGDNAEDPWFSTEEEAEEEALQMAQRDQVLIGQLGMQVSRDWLYERHDIPVPEETDEIFKPTLPAAPSGGASEDPQENPPTVKGKRIPGTAPFLAKSTEDQLAEHMLQDLTGIEAKWLGSVRPYFARLVEMAGDANVTDQELLATIEAAQKQIPELGPSLHTEAVTDALQGYMTAGLINGVARGVFQRKSGTEAGGGNE